MPRCRSQASGKGSKRCGQLQCAGVGIAEHCENPRHVDRAADREDTPTRQTRAELKLQQQSKRTRPSRNWCADDRYGHRAAARVAAKKKRKPRKKRGREVSPIRFLSQGLSKSIDWPSVDASLTSHAPSAFLATILMVTLPLSPITFTAM